jgi:choline kinase
MFSAGYGNRLKKNKPKCLVKIGKKRIIDYQLEFIKAMAPDANIYVVAGYMYDDVRSHLIGKGVNLIHNPFYDCSGINGSAWLSLKQVKSPNVWRIDGDVILTQPINVTTKNTVFFKTECLYPRETAYLHTVDEMVTSISLLDDYVGPQEWCCTEIYNNGDYQTIVSNATHLIKQGHYFESVNHALKNNLIALPNCESIEGVFEIDTKEDLKNARKKLSNR